MKKGMLALGMLSCMLLVGAPACKRNKDHSKSPPRHEKTHKKAVKKNPAKKDNPKRSACCVRPIAKEH